MDKGGEIYFLKEKLSSTFHLPLVSTTSYPPPSCPEDEDDEAEVDFDLSSPPTKVLEGLAQNYRIEYLLIKISKTQLIYLSFT